MKKPQLVDKTSQKTTPHFDANHPLDEGEKTVTAYFQNKDGSKSHFKLTKARAKMILELQAKLKKQQTK